MSYIYIIEFQTLISTRQALMIIQYDKNYYFHNIASFESTSLVYCIYIL